jgi:LuxR family transcriptional regulator, maltose regulon positive regulatory protein
LRGLARSAPAKASANRDFLARLALTVAARDSPVVLVLDDVHLLTTPTQFDDLAYVLEHASGGLRLVIASRTAPMMPLHRFRLSGRLTEIRARHLAFTTREAGQLMARYGISLSPSALQTLASRTEGWAAGLRLAALSMRGHPDPDQFAQEIGAEDSAILDYLVDEVVDTQPETARDLLLQTSILERVNDELAAELTGDAQAACVLPALVEASAFIEPLGHGWYRYHSLFADVLRTMLKREGRHDLTELRTRAAWWLRRNGHLGEAVSQASAAGDGELAARTVTDELAVGSVIQPSAGERLANDLRHVPASMAPAQAPSLLVAAAVAVRDGRPETGIKLLRAADDLLGRLPAQEDIASRLAATQIRIALARQAGDPTACSPRQLRPRPRSASSPMTYSRRARRPARTSTPQLARRTCGSDTSTGRQSSWTRPWPTTPPPSAAT